MPRQARIDAPGAVHHIIARGNEKRKIFEGEPDRQLFLARLGDILSNTETACYAWSLIPNHISSFAADRSRSDRHRHASPVNGICHLL